MSSRFKKFAVLHLEYLLVSGDVNFCSDWPFDLTVSTINSKDNKNGFTVMYTLPKLISPLLT